MLHNSSRTLTSLLAHLTLFIFVRHAAAADKWTAEFVFPATTGYVMHNMDIMEVSYKSNYPNASLWAFCYNGSPESANQIIMGVYQIAKPYDGSQLFQFNNGFSSDSCWYNLRNLDNEEKGLNGIMFSYDWKTRDRPSTLKVGSKPEMTKAPSSTANAPASTSATATSAASSGASTTAGPGAGSVTPTSGAAPSQGSDTTKAGGDAPTSLLNSTAPLISNGTTAGGGTGNQPVPPLSGGVMAGIIMGAVLGILGIVGFLAALWLVKRRRKSTMSRESRVSEREAKVRSGTYGRVEADSKALPGELCGDNRPMTPVELPG